MTQAWGCNCCACRPCAHRVSTGGLAGARREEVVEDEDTSWNSCRVGDYLNCQCVGRRFEHRDVVICAADSPAETPRWSFHQTLQCFHFHNLHLDQACGQNAPVVREAPPAKGLPRLEATGHVGIIVYKVAAGLFSCLSPSPPLPGPSRSLTPQTVSLTGSGSRAALPWSLTGFIKYPVPSSFFFLIVGQIWMV